MSQGGNMKHNLIENFEAAVRKHEFRGGGRPAEKPYIEHEYAVAKARLEALVEAREEEYTKRTRVTEHEMGG